MTSLSTLTTPEEYINYYYNLLKTELDKKDLQISKVGFIGFLLNILGFTQFDIKNYYDFLFKEAFPVTADVNDNLILHSSIYGYYPGLAVSASLIGTLSFDFSKLPKNNADKREIYLKDIKTNISGLSYILDSDYVITILDNSQYSCRITMSDNKVYNIPFTISNNIGQIIIKDFNQYSSYSTSFVSSTYLYGSFYSYIIDLGDIGNVSNIQVYVDNVEYTVRFVKWFSAPSEEVVFAKFLSENKILIELGSGVHGKYIPNSLIRVDLKLTGGSSGNISSLSIGPTEGYALIYDTVDDIQSSPSNYSVNNIISFSIDYGIGGVDSQSGSDLRSALLQYISSRDNLISESDYSNILSNYVKDYLLMFKKTSIVENNIYLFLPILDSYLNPIKTISYSEDTSNFSQIEYLPEIEFNSEEYISPFYYEWDEEQSFYKTFIINNQSTYFSDIVLANSSITETPPPLTINIESTLDSTNSITEFKVVSFEDVSTYVCKISIPVLNIDSEDMTYDSTNDLHFYVYNDYIVDPVTINIKIYDSSSLVHLFIYTINDVQIVYETTDIFNLKIYNDRVLLIPFLLKETYEDNTEYYTQKLIDLFVGLSISENRTISDDLQMRLFNSVSVPSNILSLLTIQELNFDLKFPLYMTINIIGQKSIVTNNRIDVSTDIDNLKIELAKLLKDQYTGSEISFYSSTIIDFIYNNLTWVKSVSLSITDADDNSISNIEIRDYKDILSDLTKQQIAEFCPYYFWWSLDDITINTSLE